MGKKRLLTVAGVTSFVIFLVVMLLFQVGADEKLVETFIPRIERRLGVEISYSSLDASLSSLSIEKIEVRSQKRGQLFATVEEAILSVRVGPLFFGEIDLTGLRVEGLVLRVGESVDGAGVDEWRRLFAIVAGKLGAGGSEGSSRSASISSPPEITVKRGSIHGVLGDFEVNVEDLDGRFVAEGRLLGKSGDYSLSHAGQVLARGSGAVFDWSGKTRTTQVDLARPEIYLPEEPEGIVAVWDDALEAARSVGSDDLTEPQAIADQGAKESSTGFASRFGIFAVHLGDASLWLRRGESISDRPLFSAGAVDWRWTRGGGMSLRASGALLSGKSAHKVTAALSFSEESPRRLELEAPSVPLKRIAGLLSLPEEIDVGKAQTSLSLSLEQEPGSDLLRAQGQLGVTGLIIDHPKISSYPIVDFDGRADFDLLFDRESHTVKIERLELTRQMLRAMIKGEARLDRLACDVTVSVPSTPCRQVYAAVPEALRTRLSGLILDGRFGLEIRLSLDKEKPEEVALEVDLKNECRIADLGTIPDAPFFKGPFAYMAYDENGDDLRLVTGPGTQRWSPLGLISPYAIEALLTTEDGKFWHHNGVTIPEIRRAVELNLKEGTVTHGASTLTMQLAKNLFLTRDRTVARKLQELFFVWYLETRFQKDELLELYFNVVEFGPSLYGITDAAAYYFGRAPGELNQLESVFLVKLLPNPLARHSAYMNDELSPRQTKVLHRVLKTMRARGRLTEAEYRAALHQRLDFHQEGEPLPPPRGPMTRLPGGSSHGIIYRDEWSDPAYESDEGF